MPLDYGEFRQEFSPGPRAETKINQTRPSVVLALVIVSPSLLRALLSLLPRLDHACSLSTVVFYLYSPYYLKGACVCVRVPREKVWQEMCPRDKPTHGGFKMAVISSVLLASAELTERGAAPYLDGLLSGFTRGFHESLSHFTLSYISPLSSLFVIRTRIYEHSLLLEKSSASVQPT